VALAHGTHINTLTAACAPMAFVAACRDHGLPPCVFAALVPNNASRTVSELLDAVWRDHAAMVSTCVESVIVLPNWLYLQGSE